MYKYSFEEFFKPNDSKSSEEKNRDKFLSRLFGIFSEEIVRCWCSNSNSLYEDLGRPVIRGAEDKGISVLDFTFRSRKDKLIYIVELKCELERNNYKFLKLKDISQLKHHQNKKAFDQAFDRFVKIAKNPNPYTVTTKNIKDVLNISGAILIWGSITESGRTNVIDECRFKDVLSLENMISDLINWKDKTYFELNENRLDWCQEFFNGLNGR